MDVTQLIQQLPPYQGNRRLLRKRQSIKDLQYDMMHKHESNIAQCDIIARYFWKGNALNTAIFLFDFCKQNLIYKEEGTTGQSVKSIAGILVEKKGDCKHYAQFIVGICQALYKQGYPIWAKYRYVIYSTKPNNDGVRSGHVFAVVIDPVNNKEYFCDPVLPAFDQRFPKYIKKEDKIPPTCSPLIFVPNKSVAPFVKLETKEGPLLIVLIDKTSNTFNTS